jgi:hypothetical protein
MGLGRGGASDQSKGDDLSTDMEALRPDRESRVVEGTFLMGLAIVEVRELVLR